jgi:hypothetical protein
VVLELLVKVMLEVTAPQLAEEQEVAVVDHLLLELLGLVELVVMVVLVLHTLAPRMQVAVEVEDHPLVEAQEAVAVQQENLLQQLETLVLLTQEGAVEVPTEVQLQDLEL